MFRFVSPNHPILIKVAQKIPKSQISSSETQKIIQTMLSVAYGQQKNKKRPIMVGLAAPQIGISKRIILVDVKANGKGKVGDLHIYINPQIIWKSEKKAEWYEGCYSTSRVCGIVSRPFSIKFKGIRYYPKGSDRFPTERWKFLEEKHIGYTARIFQHEIDHLQGKVFVDKIKDPTKLHWVLKKEFTLYRNKRMWRDWPNKCSFEKWSKIKYGYRNKNARSKKILASGPSNT